MAKEAPVKRFKHEITKIIVKPVQGLTY